MFGIFLVGLVIAVFFYLILKLLAKCIPRLGKVKISFNDKLFYNGWIRYLIEANLKTTHTCTFYLYITMGTQLKLGFGRSVRLIMLVVIVIFPFFALVFLFYKKNKLEDPEIKKHFSSLYSGIRLKSRYQLTYTSVFCFRRLFIVGIFLLLDGHGFWLVIVFNIL